MAFVYSNNLLQHALSWQRGNRDIFHPGFSAEDMVHTRDYVAKENGHDLAGKMIASEIWPVRP